MYKGYNKSITKCRTPPVSTQNPAKLTQPPQQQHEHQQHVNPIQTIILQSAGRLKDTCTLPTFNLKNPNV